MAGVGVIVSVPDIVTSDALLWPISKDPDFQLIRVCKEDEGISICAALSYSNKRALLLMQQTGLMDSLNAIRAIAMQQRGVILDGNVKRVLARFHAVTGHYSEASVNKLLWQRAEEHTPTKRVDHYTQAIMDLGATLCVRSKPDCQACPLSKRCQALAEDRVQELPTKKKAAAKPIRQARFFVLRLPDNRVLLEQRQQSGLWGGLWNPPERGVEVSIETFLRHQGVAQQDVIATQNGERFRHTFSHFHLDIEPVYIDLKRQPQMLQETNQRWVVADRLNQPTVQAAKPSDETIGLSAAAVKILAP